jgi:hypothetical protein
MLVPIQRTVPVRAAANASAASPSTRSMMDGQGPANGSTAAHARPSRAASRQNASASFATTHSHSAGP